ncbi:hypothetical protein M513_12636, partial [Trichuris suis]
METELTKRRNSTVDSRKKKRKAITLEQKVDVIKRHARGDSNAKISRELKLHEASVRGIIKREDIIKKKSEVASDFCGMQTTTRNRSLSMIHMERLLAIWIEDCNQKRIPLDKAAIQAKAKNLFSAVQAKIGEVDGRVNFLASNGWFERLKKRAKLHNVKMSGEAASADSKAAAQFPATLRGIIEQGGYTDRQIFNVDETALFWKRMPTRTYLSVDERTQPGYSISKERFTLLLGGNAEGDFKLKPMLVYKSLMPRALKGYIEKSLPVIWRANRKAWVTRALFEDWFLKYFCPAVERYCKQSNLAFKALLILDNAPSHPITLGQLNENVQVIFLPPNTTPLLQPMDQGVIATFKAYYLRQTFEQAVAEATGSNAVPFFQFWKKYNIRDAIENVYQAWQKVSGSTMRSAWKFLLPDREDSCRHECAQVEGIIEEITEVGISKLNLEDLNAEVVKEVLESKLEEMTNEDLLNCDVQNAGIDDSEEDEEDSSGDRVKAFSLKELGELLSAAEALKEKAMNADPDVGRSMQFGREVDSAVLVYKRMYEAKAKSGSTQTTLFSFFQKTE